MHTWSLRNVAQTGCRFMWAWGISAAFTVSNWPESC